MNRELNTTMMQSLYQQLACTSNPMARRALFEAHYLHQIIEAVLSENIASLPETTARRPWAS
jgi:hypothetical protein